MPTLLQLREQRQTAYTQAMDYLGRSDAGDELSPEDNQAWDRAVADVDSLGEQIDRITRSQGLDAALGSIDNEQRNTPTGAGDPAATAYRETFLRFMRGGTEMLSPEQRAELQSNFVLAENRAQSTIAGAAGGYTVPPEFLAKITETLKYYGGMLNVVEVLDTDTGAELLWPTNDDTSNTGAILAENAQIGAQDLSFGQKKLAAYMYTSQLILVSLQLLQDTAVDIEAFLAKKIGQRLGRIWNTHLTTGIGAPAQPQGFVTGATTGKTTAGATAITYDELVDVVHSVDVAYRGPNVRWMFHDLVLAYVRKLKDSQNRPIWNVDVSAGAPSTLLGYQYTVNNDMDSTVATTKKTAAFGDFNAMYVARRAGGMQMMRLTERYADYLQVGFFAFARLDGIVQDASAVKLLVQA